MSEDVGVDFRLFLEQYKNDIEQIKAGLDGIDKKAKEEAEQVSSHFKTAAGLVAGYFTVDAAKGFATQLINVRGEFEKYQAVLTNTLGTEREAIDVQRQLAGFASKTPNQLSEVTESYIKYVNQGFKPTIEQMRSLGDLASSVGKTYDTMTEAVIDAMVGENERLKEFGIRAEKNGDIIKYTFKGVTTEVQNNSEAIRNYLIGLGDMDGVKGSMEAISGTIPGMVSNLEDAIDKMFNDMGTDGQDVIKDTIGWTIKLVENWENVADILKVIIATYGAYKAATIVTGIMNQVQAAGSLTKALQQTAVAQKALNLAQAASPVGLVLAGITALATALFIFGDNSKKATDEQKGFNDELERTTDLIGQQQFIAFQRQIGLIKNELVTLPDGTQQMVTVFDSSINVIEKFSESLKGLREGELENYKQFFEAELVSIQRSLEDTNLDGLTRQLEEQKLKEYQDALALVNIELEKYAKIKDGSSGKTTIKDLEAELSVLEKKYKEATDISDTAELEKLKKLILAKRAEIEQFKIEAQKAKDPLAEFKKELDKQKQLYAEYEAVKSEISRDEADKLYADLLQKGATYEAYLRALLTGELTNGKKGIIALELKGVTKNDDKAADKAANTAQDYLDSLIEATRDTDALLDDLFQEYFKNRELLMEQGLTDHVEVLDKQLQAELEAILKTSGAYDWLYKSIDNYNRKALKDYIARIHKELELSNLSAEQRIELEKHLAAAQEKLDQKLSDNLADVASILGEAANLAAVFDDNLAKALGTASELASAASSIAMGITTDNYVQAITGELQAITTVAKYLNSGGDNGIEASAKRLEDSFKRIARALSDLEKNIDKALGLEKIAALNRGLEVSVALTKKLPDNYNDMMRALAQADGKRSFGAAQNAEIQELINQYGKGTREFYEAMLSSPEMLAYLSQEQIEVLQEQLDQYDELEQAAREYQNQLYELMTGTTFESMRDELVSMFNDGKTSVEDFTEYFETLMKKAIIESLSVKYLDEKLQGWYDAFGVAFEGDEVLSPEERAALKKMYDETIYPVVEQINEATKLYNDIAGTGTDGGTKGSIQGITQETASIMAGHLGNMRLNLAALVQGAGKHLEVLNRMDTKLGNIERYTKDTRDALQNTSF